MAIDVESSQGQLFKRLANELHDRRTGRRGNLRWNRQATDMKGLHPPLELLWDYFRGEPPLSEIHRGFEDHIRRVIRTGRLNIAGLLVSSTGARLSLRGFHTAEANDEAGDQTSREMMQATNLSLVSRDVHDFMLAIRCGYVIVNPPKGDQTWAMPTAEDPRQVITGHDPVTGAPRGGLKMFRDDWDASDGAYLYTPTSSGCEVQQFRRESPRSIIRGGPFWFDPDNWNAVGTAVKLDRFPIVPFRNKHGVGEFEEHLDTLDRINDKIFNEWWIGKAQAFRQLAIKNLPDEDDDGNPIDYTDVFTLDPGQAWKVPADVEFWESQPTDLTGLTNSIKHDLERLAAAVSQPLHTITPDAATGSAEGASLMREEHIFKIEDRRDRTTPRWAEVASIIFDFSKVESAKRRTDILPNWGPAQRYSLQEKSNSASQVGRVAPLEWIWSDVLQIDPSDIPTVRAQMGRNMLWELALGTAPGQANNQPPGAPAPPADQPAPPTA